MNYREVTFKTEEGLQYRDAWLEWRHQGIGSSDVPVIMGVSRFNDSEKLLASKSRSVPEEDNRNSYIKERGNKVEFQVRMFLEKHMGKTFAPANTEHIHFPFLKASLDGFSEDKKHIVEIKLLSSVNPAKPNTETTGYLKWLQARNAQEVPREYWPQIQHQLFVTGADICFFVGYKEVKGNQVVTEGKLAIIPVLPDKEYQRVLVQKCFAFWLDVLYSKDNLKRIEKELE